MLDLGRGPDGKRRREWHSGYKSPKEAEKARTALLKALDDGSRVAPNKDTVGAFLASWVPAVRATVRPTTAQLYETLVNAYVIPALGDVKLTELSPEHLNAFYASLRESGSRQSGRGLAPKTIRNIHGVVFRALRDAVRWHKVAYNAAANADPPKVPHKEATAWSGEATGAFLRAVESDRLTALWRLAAMTGLRRGELCGLRWQDVDLDASRVTVVQVAAMVDSQLIFAEPKTANSRRSVAIDPETAAVLRGPRTRQREERIAWGPAWTDSGLVFTHEDGTALRPATVTRMFGQLVRRAGLPPLTLHGLRHSHITALLRVGQPVRVVSARAGHFSPGFTLSTYAHVMPGDDEAAAAAAVAALR